MSGPPRSEQGRFETTHWSLIKKARGSRNALNELLTNYWPALQTFLILKWRMSPHDADDLVQSFIEQKVLTRDLIGRADPAVGRFRNLLMRSLERFVINELKKQRPHSSLELEDIDQVAGEPAESPGRAFDVAWARQLLSRVLQSVRVELQSTGRAEHWEVFRARVLLPMAFGSQPRGYDDIAREFGFRSPAQASNALVTAKRLLHRQLHVVIAEYADPDCIEDELRDLHSVLTDVGSIALDLNESRSFTRPDSNASEFDSLFAASSQIAKLLASDDGPAGEPGMPALLDSQLNTCLAAELEFTETELGQLRTVGAGRPQETTFADVLFHPAPPIDVLEKIKRFAKQRGKVADTECSHQIAAVLYLAAISAARTRCHERISGARDEELLRRLGWASRQEWIDPTCKSLFLKAISLLT